MKVAFRSVVCLGMIAGTALGEPPQGFDTTGHPLKVKVPRAVVKRAMESMLASMVRSKKLARAYNLPESDSARQQRRDFFEPRLRVCGAVKQYRMKYTADTLRDSTPVTAFTTWRDSSYQVYLCIGDSLVREQSVVQHYGKPYCRGGGGEASTLSEMERVLAAWPPARGYNPVFIKLPAISRKWYFHLPGVDPYNYTPLSDTVDYRKLQYSKSLFNRPQTRRNFRRAENLRKAVMQRLRKEYENEKR